MEDILKIYMEKIEEYIDIIIKLNPIRIVISNKSDKEYKYNKVKINKNYSKEKSYYQIEFFTEKQVFHENIEDKELREKLIYFMGKYKQLSSTSENYSCDMRISKKGKIFFSKKEQKNTISINREHNKKKNYILKEGMDIPPLKDLGIFTQDGKVVNSKYDKYKQINRFIEIIDDEIKKVEKYYLGESDNILRVLDFGCGKSYLTFILYYYFTEIKKMKVDVIGLDLKQDVIDRCNEIAKKYGYENLKFEIGDINGYRYENNVDMVITLHACDTATDYALYNAINWNAKMIFSVPCCQHEINSSIKAKNLNILTKYGIIQERVSALFTDAIRANLLEVMGYRTQLLEFIDISHSPKNILIRAVKSNISSDKRKKSLMEIENLRREFYFDQTLYNLLEEKIKNV